jgi:methylthioribose-1-phosphate isomerase
VSEIRPVVWVAEASSIRLLDQTRLPLEEIYVDCVNVDMLVDAISRLVVRGAPALGVVGAYGVALAIHQGQGQGWSQAQLQSEILRIRDARPTAVNLAWGVDQVTHLVKEGLDAVLEKAHQVAAEDEAANRLLSKHGADWIIAQLGSKKFRVLTHCNTGSLATSTWGTGLGIIRELNARGLIETVYADETRPLLQGSRLTAWELAKDGIDYQVQVDGAAASTILRGLVDFAVIGADRIAKNGDTANKIGSLGVAIACKEAGIPFVVAAPSSTVDISYADGEHIEIELRSAQEVTNLAGIQVALEIERAYNPAFDVTPSRFVSAVVTEKGVARPNLGESVEGIA